MCRVVSDQPYLLQRYSHCFGSHLHKNGVCPLAYISARLPDDHFLNFRITVQFDSRPTLLRKTEAQTNILVSRSDPDPTPQCRVIRLRSRFAPPYALLIFCPVALLGAGRHYLRHGNPFGQRRADAQEAALMKHIARPQLDRVHAQCFRQLVHLPFGSIGALWPAKSPEGARWDVVGEYTVGININIRDFVW